MSALKKKVMQNWLAGRGFHAPEAGIPYRSGPMSSVEVNAQKPNRKRAKPLVMKRRKPKFRSF